MIAPTKIALALIAFVMASGVAQAQVMLIGSTSSGSPGPVPSAIVDVDPVTGLATNPRDTGIRFLAGIATEPSTGHLFSLSTVPSNPPMNALFRIDVGTGLPTLVGPTGLNEIVEGDLAFNPINGLLYGIQDGTGPGVQRRIFRMNPDTGIATIIGPTGSTGDLSALAFNPTGFLYSIDSTGTSNSLLHVIDPNTGLITNTMSMNVNLGSAVGMTFDPITGAAYVADGGDASATNLLYQLDVTSGMLSAIGPTNIPTGISGLAFTPVPEPGSLCLTAIGIAYLAVRKRHSVSTYHRLKIK